MFVNYSIHYNGQIEAENKPRIANERIGQNVAKENQVYDWQVSYDYHLWCLYHHDFESHKYYDIQHQKVKLEEPMSCQKAQVPIGQKYVGQINDCNIL